MYLVPHIDKTHAYDRPIWDAESRMETEPLFQCKFGQGKTQQPTTSTNIIQMLVGCCTASISFDSSIETAAGWLQNPQAHRSWTRGPHEKPSTPQSSAGLVYTMSRDRDTGMRIRQTNQHLFRRTWLNAQEAKTTSTRMGRRPQTKHPFSKFLLSNF